MDAMEKIVDALRSANKKCKARKTCQECKQYGNGLNCVYLLMADELISCGVTVQEWISVDDRLPEFPGHYLVCTSINYWHGGCMDINENHKYHQNGTPVGYDGSTMSVLDCYYDITGHWNRVCDRHVTHWMPLPEPPKGE